MKRLAPSQSLERIDVCGQPRLINAAIGTHQTMPWSATEARLRDALSVFRISLAPLVECGM